MIVFLKCNIPLKRTPLPLLCYEHRSAVLIKIEKSYFWLYLQIFWVLQHSYHGLFLEQLDFWFNRVLIRPFPAIFGVRLAGGVIPTVDSGDNSTFASHLVFSLNHCWFAHPGWTYISTILISDKKWNGRFNDTPLDHVYCMQPNSQIFG